MDYAGVWCASLWYAVVVSWGMACWGLAVLLMCICPLLPWPQMMGSVTRSKRALAEIFESGSNILVNMAGNRERLKVCLVLVF